MKHILFFVGIIFILTTVLLININQSTAATSNYEAPVLLDITTATSTATATVTVTVAATGTLTADIPNAIALAFILDITNCTTDATDHLDVYVQTLIGEDWIDVVHFTQIDGNGSDTLLYIAKINANTAETMFETSSALAESTVRNMFGRKLRVRYVVTDSGDGNALFTFAVRMVTM